MPVRTLTLAAACAYAAVGPLAALVLPAGVGWPVTAVVLLAWAGLGGLLIAVLLVMRDQQRSVRELHRRTSPDRSGGVDDRALASALEEQTRTQQERTAEQLEASSAALTARLDHRILGLHELLAARGGDGPAVSSGAGATPRAEDRSGAAGPAGEAGPADDVGDAGPSGGGSLGGGAT